MDQDKDGNDKSDGHLFKRIPIIAIIFPPIGFLMLLNYALKKMLKGSKDNG
ncbi:hypothetical protein OAI75_01720 [Woeseiaceae bacterium]|nr:hypothetical protein [Woeseiaceae bacterium]